VLTESDGPYEYRGLKLTPKMISNTIDIISSIKGIPVSDVKSKVFENFNRFIR